jgi:hypothetical protein
MLEAIWVPWPRDFWSALFGSDKVLKRKEGLARKGRMAKRLTRAVHRCTLFLLYKCSQMYEASDYIAGVNEAARDSGFFVLPRATFRGGPV